MTIVAEQCNSVAFNVSSQGIRPRFVLNAEPKKRHAAQRCANRLLQREFSFPNLLGRGRPLSSRRATVANSLLQGLANYNPEDGAPVVSATGFGNALMLLKPESTEGGRRGSVLKRPEGAPVNLG